MVVEWSRQFGIAMEIGIGINTGEMAVGIVGSTDHMKIGAIGDAVNVASRVQGLTTVCGYSVLLTQDCYDELGGHIALYPCGSHTVKGRVQPVEIFGAVAVIPVETRAGSTL